MPEQQAITWYVLNHIGGSGHVTAQSTVDRFNTSFGCHLELFAPTYVVRDDRGGDVRYKTARLTFHYVFVRGTLADVKRLCTQPNGFSFLLDRTSDDRYATVDDRTMTAFKNIARAYRNCLPYFSLEDIELEDGDLVEVVRGDFPGLVGRYMPNARSKTGSVVLSIYNNVGTVVFNVKATDVRVLEFSRNSTRANDQIDAFVPHLLSALVCHHREEALPEALAAKLAVFCGRMGVARLGNRKLDARLQILLYAANRIIGNTAEAESALAHFDRISASVTNEWTLALIALIRAVFAGDLAPLAPLHARLAAAPAPSRARRHLLSALSALLGHDSTVAPIPSAEQTGTSRTDAELF